MLYTGIDLMNKKNLDHNPIQSNFDTLNLYNYLSSFAKHPNEEINTIAMLILDEFY